MAGERRINFGADATDARYAIEDTGDGANFVLARDTSGGGTVLLEYDDAAGEWVNRGGVNMDGNDISNIGTVDANSVSTENINISEIGQYISASDTNGSVEFASGTTEIEGDNNSNFIDNPDYGLFIVTGTLQGAESNRFLDIVLHVGASSPTVVDSNQNASPGSRTYSTSGFQFLIAIDDSGEVYDVQYFQLSSRI